MRGRDTHWVVTVAGQRAAAETLRAAQAAAIVLARDAGVQLLSICIVGPLPGHANEGA